MRAWKKANPERARELSVTGVEQRRARMVNASGRHTTQEWRQKLDLFAHCCVYCGRDDLSLTRDHNVPLVRGGTNEITNILPACKPCNTRKHTRTAAEYIAVIQARMGEGTLMPSAR